MKIYIYFTFVFLVVLSSCSQTKVIVGVQDIYLKQVKDTIFLKSGTYLLNETISIPSNTYLKGNKTNLRFTSQSKFPLVQFKDISSSGIEAIEFSSSKIKNNVSKEFLEKFNYKNVVFIDRSKNVKINNCTFKDSYGTIVKINDSENVKILNSSFKDSGTATNSSIRYSCDAIFIGGYKQCKDIEIFSNQFINIGSVFPSGNLPWPNDGDGIHIQSKGNIENVDIYDNYFEGCSSRGVKVQSGRNININNSSFVNCRSAVIITMAYNVDNITIDNNSIKNSEIPFGSGGSKTVSNLSITNNVIDNCEHFFRTSERSFVDRAKFLNNTVNSIGTYFMIGRFKNTIIENNTVQKYAVSDNKSYNYCIYLSPESESVAISKNYFGKNKRDNRELVLKSDNKISVSENTFKVKNE